MYHLLFHRLVELYRYNRTRDKIIKLRGGDPRSFMAIVWKADCSSGSPSRQGVYPWRMTMSLSFEDFTKALIAQLSEEERRDSVAYVAEGQLPAGTHIQFPGIRIDVPTATYLGFIDQEPRANWGHPARYVLISQESGEIHSLTARFPPFRSGENLRWRVVYQAPSVPDSAVEHLQ